MKRTWQRYHQNESPFFPNTELNMQSKLCFFISIVLLNMWVNKIVKLLEVNKESIDQLSKQNKSIHIKPIKKYRRQPQSEVILSAGTLMEQNKDTTDSPPHTTRAGLNLIFQWKPNITFFSIHKHVGVSTNKVTQGK